MINSDSLSDENCISLTLEGNYGDEAESVVYTYSVSASDAYGDHDDLGFSVTVHPEVNNAPVAQTDTYITTQPEHDGVMGGEAIVFISSANSFDVDGDPLTCSWASETVDLSNALEPGTLFSLDGTSACEFDFNLEHDAFEGANNIHTLVLTVSDIYGETGTSELLVEVLPEDNQAPIVSDFSCDVSEMNHDGVAGGDLNLDCTKDVADPDNDDWYVSYAWCYTIDDDEICSGNDSFTISVDDSYEQEVTLRACDGYNEWNTIKN